MRGRGWALAPDKVADGGVAGGPLPSAVHAHVGPRGPPDVAPLHLEEGQLRPDEIELYLGGNFCQGASRLKLAEVVAGAPVGARGGRVEEQAAEVHRVPVHPPLRATSLLKVKVNDTISVFFVGLQKTGTFWLSKGDPRERWASASRTKNGGFTIISVRLGSSRTQYLRQ